MDDSTTAPPLTSGDVARIFNVHPTTVMDWADKGRLRHFLTPGGQRRFRPEDVEAFLAPAQPEDAA